MYATIDYNSCTTIISCYRQDHKETGILIFYNALSFLVQHIPKYNVQIIDWDMNTYIGEDRNNNSAYTTHQKVYLADFFPEELVSMPLW